MNGKSKSEVPIESLKHQVTRNVQCVERWEPHPAAGWRFLRLQDLNASEKPEVSPNKAGQEWFLRVATVLSVYFLGTYSMGNDGLEPSTSSL